MNARTVLTLILGIIVGFLIFTSLPAHAEDLCPSLTPGEQPEPTDDTSTLSIA
jgi:hypothetical protein